MGTLVLFIYIVLFRFLQPVALKLEDTGRTQLKNEAEILTKLKSQKGFPWIVWYGETPLYNGMAMKLLGPSLEILFQQNLQKFSLNTVLNIADQLLCRLETIHEMGIIHRDLKPANFVIGGNNKEHVIHLIDFGLSKYYQDRITKEHIPFKTNCAIVGNRLFMSTNGSSGNEMSRRDDLESVGFVLLYLLTGGLPWQGHIVHSYVQLHDEVGAMKKTSLNKVYLNCPAVFKKYNDYVGTLNFEQTPDYNKCKGMFRMCHKDNPVNFNPTKSIKQVPAKPSFDWVK